MGIFRGKILLCNKKNIKKKMKLAFGVRSSVHVTFPISFS